MDALEVERLLVDGRLACPGCSGELRPWGHARWRTLRGQDEAALLLCAPFLVVVAAAAGTAAAVRAFG